MSSDWLNTWSYHAITEKRKPLMAVGPATHSVSSPPILLPASVFAAKKPFQTTRSGLLWEEAGEECRAIKGSRRARRWENYKLIASMGGHNHVQDPLFAYYAKCFNFSVLGTCNAEDEKQSCL